MKSHHSTKKIPDVFHNYNFSLFFSARLTSQFGDQVYTFAISWYILQATNSSIHMAIPLILNTMITFIVSLFGGFIADRWNRKHIMILTDFIQGVILLIMVFFIYNDWMQIWMIYLFTAILALCSSIFSPAASAVIPDIVREEHLIDATSANQFTMSFCAMAGMLASGIIYSLSGIIFILIFNAVSNFLSAVLESKIQIKRILKNNQTTSFFEILTNVTGETKKGLDYVKRNEAIFKLLIVNSIFNFIALPVGLVYIPYYFNVILHSSVLQLAIPQAALWLGMILSTFLAPFILGRFKLSTLIWRGLIFMAVCTFAGIPFVLPYAILHLSTDTLSLVWIIINFCCGVTVNLFTVPMYTLFHKYTSDEFRGRFWGFENSIRNLALCNGYLLAGLLVQNFSLGILNFGVAFIMLVIALWVRGIKSIRTFDNVR